MAVLLNFLFVLTIGLIADAQRTYVPFNCQRLNSPCVATQGGQCQSSGVCQCVNSNFLGYNCGLQSSLRLTGASCTRTCQNNGICYAQGSQSACFCQPAYYGPNCENSRVEVLGCDGDSMTVLVNPHETGVFSGRIYVSGHPNNADCNINVPAASPFQGFTKTLSFTSNNPCSGGLTTSSNGREKRYSVLVQYDSTMITPTDELHTFQCSQTSTGQFIGLALNQLTFSQLSGSDLTGADRNVGHVPLAMTVTFQPNRTPFNSGVVRVGMDLFLEITLTSSTTFTSFRLDDLRASDSFNSPTTNKTLVTNGCPVAVSNGILVEPLRKPDSRTILVPFRMFKYLNSDSVYFYASTSMCTASEANNCSPRVCSGGAANGFGRKKRQSGDEPSVGEVSTRLFVLTQDDQSVNVESCPTDEKELQSCFDSPVFVAMVIVAGILLLIALVILIMICIRVNYNRRKAINEMPVFPPPTVTRM